MDLYQLSLRIKAEGVAEAKRALGTIDTQGKAIAGRFASIGKSIGRVGVLAAAGAVGTFLKSAIEESQEAERVLGQLRLAVENVGGNFEAINPALDGAVNRLAKFTRFSDEEARRALTRMILISGDTAGAIENIGIASDIAAAKGITLENAAEKVGKVMAGNTRGLKEFGIETQDSGEALDQLRAKFRGFAEQDGKTMEGALRRIRNAWSEVLEAFGNAVTGSNSIPEALGKISEKLLQLAGWIEGMAPTWQGWARSAFKWIDEVQKRMERLERIAHAIYEFTHPGQVAKTIGRDVTSGSSSGSAKGPDFQDVTSGGTRRPPPPSGSTGGTGRRTDNGVPIPDFDFGRNIESATMERIAQIGQTPEPFDMSDFAGMTTAELDEFFKTVNGKIEEGAAEMDNSISTMFANTLGDAVYNAFAAAFNGEGLGGIFAAFGKTVLAGIGEIFTMMGQQYLTYGIIMSGLVPSLTNPFTAGPAAIAIGAALIALGSALGAVASGGGGRGTASAGAFRERAGGTQEIVRLKFVDRPGYANNLVPATPMHFTVIGPNDPKAQRAIGEIVAKEQRRRG